MRSMIWFGVGSLALLWTAATAKAGNPYLAQYNRDRAYRHFLSSPSPYKVFSTGARGFEQIEASPFNYRRLSVTGTYEQQRIHPNGFERYRILPGYEIEEADPLGYRFAQAPPVATYQYVPPLPYPPLRAVPVPFPNRVAPQVLPIPR